MADQTSNDVLVDRGTLASLADRIDAAAWALDMAACTAADVRVCQRAAEQRDSLRGVGAQIREMAGRGSK